MLKEKYLHNAADARIFMSTYRVDFYLVPIKKYIKIKIKKIRRVMCLIYRSDFSVL